MAAFHTTREEAAQLDHHSWPAAATRYRHVAAGEPPHEAPPMDYPHEIRLHDGNYMGPSSSPGPGMAAGYDGVRPNVFPDHFDDRPGSVRHYDLDSPIHGGRRAAVRDFAHERPYYIPGQTLEGPAWLPHAHWPRGPPGMAPPGMVPLYPQPFQGYGPGVHHDAPYRHPYDMGPYSHPPAPSYSTPPQTGVSGWSHMQPTETGSIFVGQAEYSRPSFPARCDDDTTTGPVSAGAPSPSSELSPSGDTHTYGRAAERLRDTRGQPTNSTALKELARVATRLREEKEEEDGDDEEEHCLHHSTGPPRQEAAAVTPQEYVAAPAEAAAPLPTDVHSAWDKITIGTAKCDFCPNGKRRSVLQRCKVCSRQCCQECWSRKRAAADKKSAGNGQFYFGARHVMNEEMDWSVYPKQGDGVRKRSAKRRTRRNGH